jgi:hypothetical protein
MSSIRANSFALVFFACAVVHAQASDVAAAESLFIEAKALMAKGDYAAACPKLAESQRLDPGTGTLTALALCHEGEGKTATAWAEFIQVLDEATRANRADREALAKMHVQKLEPTLSRITILVAPETAKLEGLVVKRDGVAIRSAQWSSPIPIDPGTHAILVEASGMKPWETSVTIGANADTKRVEVPALEKKEAEPAPPPLVVAPPPVEKPPQRSGSGQRIAGVVVIGAGLAAAGIGAYFGVRAISSANDANKRCTPELCTDPAAIRSNNDAKGSALAADILIVAGAAVAATGFVIVLLAPSASASAQLTPSLGGAMLRGTF